MEDQRIMMEMQQQEGEFQNSSLLANNNDYTFMQNAPKQQHIGQGPMGVYHQIKDSKKNEWQL